MARIVLRANAMGLGQLIVDGEPVTDVSHVHINVVPGQMPEVMVWIASGDLDIEVEGELKIEG